MEVVTKKCCIHKLLLEINEFKESITSGIGLQSDAMDNENYFEFKRAKPAPIVNSFEGPNVKI